jgi:anti-sigma B factor antagonist
MGTMSRTLSPRLLVESIHGVTVATFADAEILTEESIEDLNHQLNDLIEGLGPARILLNFRDVRLMSSSMLAVLLKFSRRLDEARGELKLCCIDPNVMQAFRITRFDRLFAIYDEEAQALDAF